MASFLINSIGTDILVRGANGLKHAIAVVGDQGYEIDRSFAVWASKMDEYQAEYWNQAGMPEQYGVTVLEAYELDY